MGGAALVFMQFTTGSEETADLPEHIKKSRLKKTLSNAGLYPNPEQQKPGARMQRTASGSMAAFTEGGGANAILTKGGGDPM